jgi:hypothetical protein
VNLRRPVRSAGPFAAGRITLEINEVGAELRRAHGSARGWAQRSAYLVEVIVVGDTGLEPVTSCMSSKCSNQLS